LRLRNSKTAEVETDVRVHDRALSSVAWHAKLRIWNLPDFKLVQEYRMRAPGLDVRISPSGKNLYVKVGGKMAVFTPEWFHP
jgi:hypothetical protein